MDAYVQQIQDALQRATIDSNTQVGIIFHMMDTMESPPTYFKTNNFTSAYQEIVDAYGYVVIFIITYLSLLLKSFASIRDHP